jgi:hypothetical protein
MTTVTTTPISRVSCWGRKLWRPFEVQLHRRRTTLFMTRTFLFHVDTKFWGREENSFDSNSFRNRNFFAKIEL